MLGVTAEDDEALNFDSTRCPAASFRAPIGFTTGMSNCNKAAVVFESLGYSFSQNTEHFKMQVPSAVLDKAWMFMGTYLPCLTTGSSSSAERLCPTHLLAVAMVTVGKLCIRDRNVARDNVTVFLRELRSLPPPSSSSSFSSSSLTSKSRGGNGSGGRLSDASQLSEMERTTITTKSAGEDADGTAGIRSNALLILSDLCVRYTHLVSRHVDVMALSMQDPSVMVRKHALASMTQLLMQDYLKWKGFLPYRFLSMVTDPHPDVSEFARNVLKTTIGQRYPGMFTSHFPETVVILNNCRDHPIYTAVAQSCVDGTTTNNTKSSSSSSSNSDAALSFSSSSSASSASSSSSSYEDTETDLTALSREKRFTVYAFLLESLSDEVRSIFLFCSLRTNIMYVQLSIHKANHLISLAHQ